MAAPTTTQMIGPTDDEDMAFEGSSPTSEIIFTNDKLLHDDTITTTELPNNTIGISTIILIAVACLAGLIAIAFLLGMYHYLRKNKGSYETDEINRNVPLNGTKIDGKIEDEKEAMITSSLIDKKPTQNGDKESEFLV